MEQVISGQADVDIEDRQVDIDERASVVAITETTCGCRKGTGPSSQFSTDNLISVRVSCSERTRSCTCSSQASAPVLAPLSSPLILFCQCERLVLSLHAQSSTWWWWVNWWLEWTMTTEPPRTTETERERPTELPSHSTTKANRCVRRCFPSSTTSERPVTRTSRWAYAQTGWRHTLKHQAQSCSRPVSVLHWVCSSLRAELRWAARSSSDRKSTRA